MSNEIDMAELGEKVSFQLDDAMAEGPACVTAQAPSDLHQNLLVVLTVSNIALLFLVGLLARRVEALHVKLGRFVKSARMQSGAAPSKPAPTAAAPSQYRSTSTTEAPKAADFTRELVTGHVQILRKTLSNQSLRSNISADDFASLQCMLGDEDGITM